MINLKKPTQFVEEKFPDFHGFKSMQQKVEISKKGIDVKFLEDIGFKIVESSKIPESEIHFLDPINLTQIGKIINIKTD